MPIDLLIFVESESTFRYWQGPSPRRCGCDKEAYPTPLAVATTPTGAAGTNRGTHGGKEINNPGLIPSTGTGAAFHQDLWQTSIYLFKSQSISLLFIFAEDPMYRCRCCLARAMGSGDGRS